MILVDPKIIIRSYIGACKALIVAPHCVPFKINLTLFSPQGCNLTLPLHNWFSCFASSKMEFALLKKVNWDIFSFECLNEYHDDWRNSDANL